MKKIILLMLCVFASYSSSSQSFIGYLSDNYSGVNSAIANPANITDSRFKTDINLVGASAFVSNDYYGFNILDATKPGYDFDSTANTYPSSSNNFSFNTDVLGPAFMFNINENSSLALFTRARMFFNVNEVNGETVSIIDSDESDDIFIDEGDFNSLAHAWGEFGLTYARTILNKNQHFLKGGVTVKYLQGAGSTFGKGKNVTINYDADGGPIVDGQPTGSLETTGDITYSRNADFEDDNYSYEIPDNATGFGGDIGFVYEWRPDYADYKTSNSNGDTYSHKDKNKYKLKIGLSVTDIGSVNYKDGIQDNYDINNPGFSEDDFDNADDVNTFLNNTFAPTTTKNGFKVSLPTALHVNADWSFTRKLYVNLNTDLSLISKTNTNASKIANVVSLTPRFETKWFSFYLPVSAVQYSGFHVGAGLRAGPLYVGSGSVLTGLISDNSKGADVYAGLKIPIYQGQPKDKDGDGIIDKLDACPKIAGPIENNGCPWLDIDVDGVMDNVDECPNQKGPEENKGCPWGDKDGDTILDNVDDCIDVPGPIENKGCPWADTDGDGVFDKDDSCIDVVGTVANNGCPEVVAVTEEVQKTLNEYAKTILFDLGKSSIQTQSEPVLNDITNILKEYPDAKFTVEGHTDSSGSHTLNQKLSDARANAVKEYLVANGINAFRLSALGYGEDRPISENTTKSGRAKNRRVEINLVK